MADGGNSANVNGWFAVVIEFIKALALVCSAGVPWYFTRRGGRKISEPKPRKEAAGKSHHTRTVAGHSHKPNGKDIAQDSAD